MKKLSSILITLLFAGISSLSYSQTYNISGTVTDSLGKPLIGVNVIILETGFGAATNDNGNYEIQNLKPGIYTIEFSMVGFRKRTFTNQLIKNKPIILNVKLTEQPVQSEQVVVTAGKYEQKISELPVSADVLPAREIADKDITNLGDAMRYVPGVQMVGDQISIRGSSGYSRGAGTRVLLEIDGIPYYTGDTGEIIWEILPVSEIQRVEVIKGAASSLYGSSAIGGVINVITKPIGEKPVTYIKLGEGIYDKPSYAQWEWTKKARLFNQITLSHSNRFGKFGYSFSLTRLSNLNYYQSGFYKRYIGYFKGLYNFSSSSSLTFFANTLNQNHGNFLYWKDVKHALIPPDADQGQTVKSNRYMFGAVYKDVLSDDFFIQIKGSYYRTDWADQTASKNSSKTDLYRGEVQLNKTFGNNFILVSGIEANTSRVTSNIFGNPTSFGIGAYSQGDYDFNFPLKLSIGARYDFNKLNNSEGMSAFSPKAGLNYKVSDKIILRSSFGTGFRAPTLAEAFTTTTAGGLTVKPNPSIKPEKNWTAEIGVNYQTAYWVNLDAAVFQNEFYDFIEPGVDPADGLVQFSNITRARIQGLEFNSNFNFFKNHIKLSIDYTYLWARDLTKHQALRYRPRNSVTSSLDFNFDNIDAGADFRYWSKVEQMDYELVNLGILKDGRVRVPVYVLDLRASYNLVKVGLPAKVYFNINNVLNYNYVVLIGNLAPVRNYSLSMEFLF